MRPSLPEMRCYAKVGRVAAGKREMLGRISPIMWKKTWKTYAKNTTAVLPKTEVMICTWHLAQKLCRSQWLWDWNYHCNSLSFERLWCGHPHDFMRFLFFIWQLFSVHFQIGYPIFPPNIPLKADPWKHHPSDTPDVAGPPGPENWAENGLIDGALVLGESHGIFAWIFPLLLRDDLFCYTRYILYVDWLLGWLVQFSIFLSNSIPPSKG